MAFEHYIHSGQKRLRCGYTTGTCAALAAAGAAQLLLTGNPPPSVRLTTPKGLAVEVALADCKLAGDCATCAVIKDAGDDIDVTAGLPIYATVTHAPTPGITIQGGIGVGTVTKGGLDQPVGAAAINRVPRQMITDAVTALCSAFDHSGGLTITISVPQGAKVAQRTFNPNLGIVGGISILGTSGVVEPMSQQALADTIALELRQQAASGHRRVILTPGNYGMDYLHAQGLDGLGIPIVKCSNFLGDSLDAAATSGFGEILLVGHVGKLVKLAGGIMNTHSRYADCRTELFCAHAALCGADAATCQKLMDAATADGCIEILQGTNLCPQVMDSLLVAIHRHLTRRTPTCTVGAILFSNEYGALGHTPGAEEILQLWR